MKMSTKEISAWQNALIRWFRKSGKSYPWRETVDPYAILVSELMLQQTQIKTVLDRQYFVNWMEKFPDIQSLANSNIDDVLKAWEGLGYYNRARNLKNAANVIVNDHGGVFPDQYDDILALPGVGPYTAGAVTSFAFNSKATIVDGNVIRVLSRVFDYREPVDTTAGKKDIWAWAGELTSGAHPREYNSAIMELGQTICGKGSPLCNECPVSKWCLSKDKPEVHKLPIKKKAVKITRRKEEVILLIKQEQVFLCCETGSRRKGLWRLPLISDLDQDDLEQIGDLTYPITRFMVDMRIFGGMNLKNSDKIAKKYEGTWFDLNGSLPAVGAPYLRAIEEFLERRIVNK